MFHVRARVLKYPILIVLLLLTACSHVQTRAQLSGDDIRPMVLDLSKKSISTPDWQSPILECSDAQYFCLEVPGRLVIAFPKECSAASVQLSWQAPVARFQMVAPKPHFGPPSGTYVSEKFPRVLLRYDVQRGFTEVRFLKWAPSSAEFDPNAYEARYRISVRGGQGLYVCR